MSKTIIKSNPTSAALVLCNNIQSRRLNRGRFCSVVSHMRMLFLVFSAFPVVALAQVPTCAEVPNVLYGVSLGPIRNYPDGLREGLQREGTARFIEGAGAESIKGHVDNIVYPKIFALYGLGVFNGTLAISRIEKQSDFGFAHMVELVAIAAHSSPTLVDQKATFECEDGIELYVESTKWDDGPAIKVSTINTEAVKYTNAYIKDYCADPGRRRPEDACKK